MKGGAEKEHSHVVQAGTLGGLAAGGRHALWWGVVEWWKRGTERFPAPSLRASLSTVMVENEGSVGGVAGRT